MISLFDSRGTLTLSMGTSRCNKIPCSAPQEAQQAVDRFLCACVVGSGCETKNARFQHFDLIVRMTWGSEESPDSVSGRCLYPLWHPEDSLMSSNNVFPGYKWFCGLSSWRNLIPHTVIRPMGRQCVHILLMKCMQHSFPSGLAPLLRKFNHLHVIQLLPGHQ